MSSSSAAPRRARHPRKCEIHPVVVFYAVCCALTFWSASRAREEDRFDALLAAAILTAGCLLSNIAYFAHAVGDWKRIDAAVMLALLWVLWHRRQPWRVVLASLAVATMGVHALVEWADDQSELMMYAYPAALNVIFVLQLLCVASNGISGDRDHGGIWLVSAWVWRPSCHFDRSSRPPDE